MNRSSRWQIFLKIFAVDPVKSLEIASKVYRRDVVLEALSTTLQNVERPEVVTEVQVIQNNWNIDFGFRVYEGLSPHDVMELHSVWIDFLVRFSTELPSKKKKKYAEEIAFAIRNAKIFEYVVQSYCKQKQGQLSCRGCERPLGSWTPCVKYREKDI